MIAEAETFLRRLSFALVRVRLISPASACIEVARDEVKRSFDLREEISQQLIVTGFKRVTLDLEGCQQGKLNVEI